MKFASNTLLVSAADRRYCDFYEARSRIAMSKKSRHAVYLDGDAIVAETDVIRFAVGEDEHSLRSDVWTFWGSAQRPDFYLTSSLVSEDQKGSIHPTRGQFSYTEQMWSLPLENWVGPPPASRHMETIDVPPLKAGEHFHVMTIRLPGIGLRRVGRPARRPKPFVLIPSFGVDTLISLNLVLFEGDWREFVDPLPGQKAVAAIRNQDGRSLIVFLRKEREQDPVEFYNRFLGSIPWHSSGAKLPDGPSLFATHLREAHQPIFITELHDLVVTATL